MKKGSRRVIAKRKEDHLRICLDTRRVEPLHPLNACTARENFGDIRRPLAKYALPYTALPDINLSDVDPSSTFLGKKISFPFYVSSMTGGVKHGRSINEALARACEAERVPLGLGSMRIALRYPETLNTFDVKKFCPSVPLLANIGAVQLNYGVTADDICRLVDAVKADGLFIHCNALQEAVQPEGDTNFGDLVSKLSAVVKQLQVPVIVKEVGHGIGGSVARRLLERVDVAGIDVAGTGGTSWSWVEGQRRPRAATTAAGGRKKKNKRTKAVNTTHREARMEGMGGAVVPAEYQDYLGFEFRSFGVPTDECVMQCRQVISEIEWKEKEKPMLAASGGVRSGVDVAVSLALGATHAATALPLLQPALDGPEAVAGVLQSYREQFRLAMFGAGVKEPGELPYVPLRRT